MGSGDLDHILGLLLLREFQPLRVYAAPSTLRILREENSMFEMLNRTANQVAWTAVGSGAPFALLDTAGEDSGLRCEIYFLGGRYPKYVKSAGLAPDQGTAALFFEAGGKRVAYLPAIGALKDELLEKIDGADVLLFDGTFWSDDELIGVESSGETALQMGHIPVEQSLVLLKNVNVKRRIFVHINNTNPILNEAGREHSAVREAGWQIAEDNWHLDL